MKKSIILLGLLMTNAYTLTWSSVEDLFTSTQKVQSPLVAIDSTAKRNVVWRVQSTLQAIEGVSSWTSPADIFSGEGAIHDGPYLAANASGDAICYVTASENSYSVCKICEYTGGSWSAPQAISSETENSLLPVFSMTTTSDAVGIWIQRSTSSLSAIKSSVRTSGSWTAKDVTSSDGNYTNPLVGLDTAGTATSVWTNKGENHYQVCSSDFAESTWGSPVQISDLFHTIWYPALSVNSNGFGIAAWTDLMDISWNVKAAVWDDGTWSAATLVSIVGENDQNPSISVNDNGVAICVWERRQQGTLNIFSSVYSSGTWSTPYALTQGTRDSVSPKVVLNNADQAIVIWNSTENGQKKVYSSTYDSSTWATAECLIPVDLEGNFISPEVSLNDSGDVVVVWLNEPTNNGPLQNNVVQLIQSTFN